MPDASLFNGTSFITLFAPNISLLQASIDFYTNFLGFAIRKNSNQKLFWLQLEEDQNNVSIQLILDPEHAASVSQIDQNIRNLTRSLYRKDWRSIQSNIAFKSSSLSKLVKLLKDGGHPVQQSPNEISPFEVYTVDPLGSLIGFSGFKNPFAVNERSLLPKVSEEKAYRAEDDSEKLLNPVRKTIGVMTSGGDSPGMNPFVRAVVRAGIYKGCKVFCIHEGYEGLVRGGEKYIKETQWHDVRGWLVEGGTNIGTARCKEFRERSGRLKACKNMIDMGIDALIVCGGDGSLTGADRFRSEWPSLIEELLQTEQISQQQFNTHQNLNICGAVGSIDNDMSSTDATIGAFSSLDRICRAIDYIDATANSHSRAFIVEVMGRHCGWLGLLAGLATSADYILIPEKPASSREWQDQMCDIVGKHRARGKRKTIVIVAEGAISNDLSPISCDQVKDVLVNRLGLDTRVTTLGHVQRGGTAVAFDRIYATLQGVEAVNAVLECDADTPSPMIAIKEDQITRVPLVDAVELTQQVAKSIESRNFKKAISLRDSEFVEHMKNFISTNSADHVPPSLPLEKRKKIAIINVGAPAGGMNSAVYSMATYCMSRGHVPYAIHNGFSGLARHESVRSINWLDIEGWGSLGGSEIGTNRTLPNDADIGMIAYFFEKYGFDGLILVGGFEAFISLHQLERARINYPSLRIPLVLIPATISNNVPGTEYSLGSDTCLNSFMEYCDVIKQSAAATRNRVFVVEVQGGNSGYIATHAQLACGAQISYVPEEGISLAQLEMDINSLKESFANDQGKTKSGRLILKSENASKVLTTEVISTIIDDEASGRFDSKTAIPGHVQQGGIPSPMDRVRASRFAIRAVSFIERHSDRCQTFKNSISFRQTDEITSTAVVLGIHKSQLRFTPIRQLYDFESDVPRRMRKNIFWSNVREISDMLSGRTSL
ncbi:BA75_01027T0 [Komagataella pastoris]|uniref:ATP-dependent 6-phosphofructokinase subunit beta n=2 Tax=Komagataella pastoris TaxID=4922 RepID=PFKA2_PICPA|nr:RecName: Full=ATP-dependent 6-phosphofructokinase subunit beta; AltName: Full=ATP-dependent 6-phosphofructokinase 2; Short=ATP-PFK 2; Short=Phosphofructokinase 2; AltName: Full=Phosphohexokinase 2 [Komagataella pastoris]3OPY_B Chain B, 6-phosphofructo-1-kinase beta-subunit [Komagataella pastoris DSMZ 70382]3OPY_D Chain D, 6-phosphofructo-1-kinase beta-subunit [Komagataella pastoris DSMZ 70382]3OPY_F Chain F, 6-phosphofructo-1-kinase beta-subunit [Komagataella pastoris DSMZ 70382]3OPY_H Chain